jgi:hypothetical protein
MSKKIFRSIRIVYFSTAVSLLASPVFAQASAITSVPDSVISAFSSKASVFSNYLQEIVNGINNIYNFMVSSFTTSMTTVSDLIYEDDPNLPATITANSTRNTASSNVTTTVNSFVLPQIKQELTQADRNQQKRLSYLPASDTYVPASVIANITGQGKQYDLGAGDKNFDFQTLISPIVYDNTGKLQAQAYVKFAGDLSTPLMDTSLFWSSLTTDQKQKMQSSSSGQKYRVTLRNLIAARSVAVANLYHLLSDRISVKDLGTQSGIPNTADASPLQVKEYIATRRADSQDWYNSMAQASPATVTREQLYVLAEMEKQLYDLHRDNERIIATLSLLELQSIQSNKGTLTQLEQQVKKDLGINDTTVPGQNATTTLTTPPPPLDTGDDSSDDFDTVTTTTSSTTTTQ